MLQFLQSIDQFGAQQKLQIPPINPTQKSAFGGLVTLALYGISLGYFLFQFVDWQQNNKLPKVTSLQEQINEEQQLTLKGVFAEISYFKELTDQIDPFDPQNLIIQPILVSTNDYSNMTIIDATFQKKETINGKTINILYLENMQIQNSPISSVTRQYTNYQLTFGYCNPKFLKDEQNCADQHLIDKFFQQDTSNSKNSQLIFYQLNFLKLLYNFNKMLDINKIKFLFYFFLSLESKFGSFFFILLCYFQNSSLDIILRSSFFCKFLKPHLISVNNFFNYSYCLSNFVLQNGFILNFFE